MERIQDIGRGYDPKLVKNPGGIGILSMIGGSDKSGGSFSVQSKTDAGTVIQVNVPLEDHQTAILDENENK